MPSPGAGRPAARRAADPGIITKTMTSSKFGRRNRPQQPPPVCHKTPEGWRPGPAPPPPDNTLNADLDWHGLCSDDVWRDFHTTIDFLQPYPSPDGTYSYDATIDDIRLRAYVNPEELGPGKLYWLWTQETWYAVGYGAFTYSPPAPFDTEIVAAYETNPAEQTSTFRLYTSYAEP